MTTPPPSTALTGFRVPVIDLSPYTAGDDPTRDDPAARERVAREIDAACSSVGFMQIVGHGIDDAVIEGLAGAIDDFFALPPETKNGYRVAGANRGYSPPKSETLSLSLGVESAGRMNDFFEAFNVGVEARSFPDSALDEADYGINLWPYLPDFRPRIDAYFAEASRVARTLTLAFADALGVPPEVFTGITGHSIDVLRLNNYALPPGPVTLDGELTGMGEHTDFGLVTVLWADRVAGLQVLSADGVWHDVHPVEGGLLVNLGDLTARLTGDRWMSTLHRVRPPIVDGGIVRRRSAAFFHEGDVDAIVATLPDLPGADQSAYDPITVRDHIAAKLAGSRQGRANTGAVREAARVLAAAQQDRR